MLVGRGSHRAVPSRVGPPQSGASTHSIPAHCRGLLPRMLLLRHPTLEVTFPLDCGTGMECRVCFAIGAGMTRRGWVDATLPSRNSAGTPPPPPLSSFSYTWSLCYSPLCTQLPEGAEDGRLACWFPELQKGWLPDVQFANYYRLATPTALISGKLLIVLCHNSCL